MSNSELRKLQDDHTLEENGQTFDPVPMYRFANETELDDTRKLGMGAGLELRENLFEPPAILILDERGIVRWHSEGVEWPPSGSVIPAPAQYTIIQAVLFALQRL